MSLTNSEAWWERGQKVLAGGPATYSKSSKRYPANAPKVLTGGKGPYVWDADGHMYVDTVAGLGPVLLGHRDRSVDAAVHHQVSSGVSFSLMHPLEVDVAELLVDSIGRPDWQVRFCKNGYDATQAAVRLARHVTGKRHVICSGYHGQGDWYMASTDKAGGILDEVKPYTHQIGLHEIETLKDLVFAHQHDLAAIILEVPPFPWGEDTEKGRGLLQIFERMAHQETRVLFIVDEVVTGWRHGLRGACATYSLSPDLVCFGKGLANGYPLAALVGKRDFMRHFADGDVFFSTTAGGEAVSLAAAKATLTVLRETDALANLKAQGHSLGLGLANSIVRHDLPIALRGNHARMVLNFTDVPGVATAAQLRTLFQQMAVEHGVLFGPLIGPIFPMACYADETVQEILHAAENACHELREALDAGQVADRIFGSPTVETFQRYS